MSHNCVTDMVRKNRTVIAAALISSVVLSCIYFFAEQVRTSDGVLIPWRSAIIGFFGFGILYWFTTEKQLIKREKSLFSILRKKGYNAATVTEVIYQAALAGVYFLLFYLVLRERWNLFFSMFFGIMALICSVATAQLEISVICRKAVSIFAYILLIVNFIYNLTMFGYTGLSESGSTIFVPIISQLQRWMHIAGLILMIAEFRTDARRALAACLAGIPLYFVWRDSGLSLILEFAVFMLISNLFGKPRTIAKVTLVALLAYVGFLGLGFAVGWVENRTFYFDYAGLVPAYGMGHSNLPALVLMSILLLVWYLWLADHPVITFPVFWAAAVGIWFMTYCRTVVIVLMTFPLLNLYRVLLCKKKAFRGLSIQVYLPLIFGVLSVIGMCWIPTQKLFEAKGNFFLRFSYPYQFLQQYGITLFGTTIQNNFIIDNVFLHLLSFFGVVSLVVICGLLTWVGWQYYRNKQYAELTMLAIIMFYSLMENAVIHLPFGFVAMLIGLQPNQPEDSMAIKQILKARNQT